MANEEAVICSVASEDSDVCVFGMLCYFGALEWVLLVLHRVGVGRAWAASWLWYF